MIDLRLDIHGRTRLLRLADDDASRLVETLFPSYVRCRTSASSTTEPDMALEAADAGYRLHRGGDRVDVRASDLAVVLEHHVTFVLLEAASDLLHLHAAGVARSGGALLAFGGSGTGKSSIAAAWSALDYPVFGDDAVLLSPDLTAHPFHKPLKVDVERARTAGLTPEDTPYWQAEASEVWYDPDEGGGWASPARPSVLAFLDRRETGATALERIAPPDALSELLSQILVTSGRPPGWRHTLIDLVEAAPAYRVTFSDSLDAARTLASPDGPR